MGSAVRVVKTEIEIAAAPMDVWAALIDLGGYPKWNPILPSGSGEVRLGGRPTLRMASIGRIRVRFRPLVLVADPGTELRWIVKVPGVFGGDHVFALSAVAGGTRLEQSEAYSGLLAPVFGAFTHRIERRFRALNESLKTYVETA